MKTHATPKVYDTPIAIIGAGHMGRALAEGFVRAGVKKSHVTLSGRHTNRETVRRARFVFVVVKPNEVEAVLRELRHELKGKVVISAAAAVPLSYLKKRVVGARVARIMPNMPVSVQEGVIGMLAGTLSVREKTTLKQMLSGLGLVIEAKNERELEAFTLISGCGPGIVSYLMGLVSHEASRLGIPRIYAEEVAFRTFKGTVAYMEKCRISAADVQRSVATKGGITNEIVTTLKEQGFGNIFRAGMKKGRGRIEGVGRTLREAAFAPFL